VEPVGQLHLVRHFDTAHLGHRNIQQADRDFLLLQHLQGRANESHVRVFTVAYGSGADVETLTRIAQATRAKSYDATDATNIGRVFTAILSNF